MQDFTKALKQQNLISGNLQADSSLSFANFENFPLSDFVIGLHSLMLSPNCCLVNTRWKMVNKRVLLMQNMFNQNMLLVRFHKIQSLTNRGFVRDHFAAEVEPLKLSN